MARVCVISPGQLGSNPRLVKEARTLSASGHAVRTITTKVMALVEPRDQDIISRADWNIERIDFTNVVHWRIRRLQQVAAMALFRFSSRAAVAAAALSAMTSQLRAAAESHPADLYIAHYPAALPAAAAAARRHGAIYAYDAEDFYLGDLPGDAAGALDGAIIRNVEARLIAGAAYVTAASPGIADAYAAEYGISRPSVLLNVFPKDQAPSSPTTRGSCETGPSVYWFSQTIGPNRGLECAVRAIAMARSRPHLFLRGAPVSGFAECLRGLARDQGVEQRVHILPPAAPSEMEHLAAAYDVGLVSETGHTLNRRIALTNKQFTYLLGGIPVVMSDTPAHRDFAAECGEAALLYAAEDPDQLADALDRLLEIPDQLTRARSAAHRLGQQRFNWDIEKERLTALVDSALGLRRQSANSTTFVQACGHRR